VIIEHHACTRTPQVVGVGGVRHTEDTRVAGDGDLHGGGGRASDGSVISTVAPVRPVPRSRSLRILRGCLTGTGAN
jgi:hypothetical protein